MAGPMQSKEKKYGQLIDEKIQLLNSMGHKVSLLGPINLNTFDISNYKCCILPSRYEGFAFLPLELSHLKIPYILSNCLGHKELLVSELDLKYSFDTTTDETLSKLVQNVIAIDVETLSEDFAKIHHARLKRYSNADFIRSYRNLFLKCI